jgi:hypothetical protein
LKKRILPLAVLSASLATGTQLGGQGYLWKALTSNYLKGCGTANIDDASNFAQRAIQKGVEKPWSKDRRYNQRPLDPELLTYLKQQSGDCPHRSSGRQNRAGPKRSDPLRGLSICGSGGQTGPTTTTQSGAGASRLIIPPFIG